MDKDAHYVTVGAFVLLVLVMAASFVTWYTGTRDRREQQRYEIYFRGSVSGLSEGGVVSYLGVSVGRVQRISIDERDPGRVQVIADIYADTPIAKTTVARLTLQGLTGLLFIDLKPADPQRRLQPPVAGIRHPVIPSEQSEFDVLVSSLPDLVARATEVLNRLNTVLSDDNVQSVAQTLGNLERASRDLPPLTGDARELVAQLGKAAVDVKAAAADVRDFTGATTPELKAAAARLRELSDNLARASARLDAFVTRNDENLSRLTGEGLLEIEQLLRESRDAAREFRGLARSLREDPSQIIYQPRATGVEVPP
ncbi:MAG: MCE family protein [Piscinibacter sp.]|jgi:phospholipid/cholesterol/gamma-HCH transport system substrate-binding protein|nr:MCE family protein [Piscinibacter sp.]MCC7200417.1 MCE family protein [Gammaproteobacteria bacterium]